MIENTFQYLKKRGIVDQFSHPNKVKTILEDKKITFYLGFDPTADSLHIGSLVPLIFLRHLIKRGHKAICLIGSGTASIGDPSGKTEARKMINEEIIAQNTKSIQRQIKKIIPEVDTFVYNADWLNKIAYMDFLREFGPIFKVNEMIKTETYKLRLERNEGLTFLEFNYQLLQAFDFLYLFEKYGCLLQIGGSDQWGNMLAGIDLIRQKHDREAYVMTVPLLTSSNGKKMGKTEKGAIWLNKEKTSPYEFFQYWINIDDQDVKKFLKIFTNIDLEIISRLDFSSYKNIKVAKEILAFEVTSLIHGKKEAEQSKITSKKMFGKIKDNLNIETDEPIPATEVKVEQIKECVDLPGLLVKIELIPSKMMARRLINGGGIYINRKKVNISYDIDVISQPNTVTIIRIGKKKYHKIKITE